jgi:hypothetical protein
VRVSEQTPGQGVVDVPFLTALRLEFESQFCELLPGEDPQARALGRRGRRRGVGRGELDERRFLLLLGYEEHDEHTQRAGHVRVVEKGLGHRRARQVCVEVADGGLGKLAVAKRVRRQAAQRGRERRRLGSKRRHVRRVGEEERERRERGERERAVGPAGSEGAQRGDRVLARRERAAGGRCDGEDSEKELDGVEQELGGRVAVRGAQALERLEHERACARARSERLRVRHVEGCAA